jgi:hypothetical protein
MHSNRLHWYQSVIVSLCAPHHLECVDLSARSSANSLRFSKTSSSYCAKNVSKSFTPWKLGGSLISVPTHLTVRSIHAHILVDTSCSLCFQFSKSVSEFVAHEVMLHQLSIPSAVGFTQSSPPTFVMYNWLISSKFRQVGSINLSPSDGSNGTMTLYYPASNVIFLVFKFIMAWLSNAQSRPSNAG